MFDFKNFSDKQQLLSARRGEDLFVGLCPFNDVAASDAFSSSLETSLVDINRWSATMLSKPSQREVKTPR